MVLPSGDALRRIAAIGGELRARAIGDRHAHQLPRARSPRAEQHRRTIVRPRRRNLILAIVGEPGQGAAGNVDKIEIELAIDAALIRILAPSGDHRGCRIAARPKFVSCCAFAPSRSARPQFGAARSSRDKRDAFGIRRELGRVVPLIGRAHGRTECRREIGFKIETLGDRRFPQVDFVRPALVGDAAARASHGRVFQFRGAADRRAPACRLPPARARRCNRRRDRWRRRARDRRRSSRRRSGPGCPRSRAREVRRRTGST